MATGQTECRGSGKKSDRSPFSYLCTMHALHERFSLRVKVPMALFKHVGRWTSCMTKTRSRARGFDAQFTQGDEKEIRIFDVFNIDTQL